MANPVICEQYIINSKIEKHLQKALTSSEHLLVCGFLGEKHDGIRAIV